VRVLGALGQLLTGVNRRAVEHVRHQPRARRDVIFDFLPAFVADVERVAFQVNLAAHARGDFLVAVFVERQNVALLDVLLVLDLDRPAGRDVVLLVEDFAVDDGGDTHALALGQADDAADVGDDGFALRLLARLEQFFDARQTARDVAGCLRRAAGVDVRSVSCVPGSPMDCAAMMPTAVPISTISPRPRSRP